MTSLTAPNLTVNWTRRQHAFVLVTDPAARRLPPTLGLSQPLSTMKKLMHALSVDTNDDGDIVLSQRIDDPNYPDPEILISPDQVPLVVAWMYEAREITVREETAAEGESIPIRFFARGPEADSENLSVFHNAQGMVVLKIDDDTFIEMSPAMAKRLRDQLSTAIRSALTQMLGPDTEA
jgi:hypothetical protein